MKDSQLIVFKVKSIIYGHGRGWCFSQNDFLGIGRPDAVRQALSRLQRSDFIRRITWGLYDYPRKHSKLGPLPPDLQQIAKAIARRDQIKLLPSGAIAANLLGLSEQVPAKVVYLTEGLSKKIRVGKQEIIFRKTTPKNMATADTFTGLAIQALRSFGQNQIDDSVIAKLKKRVGKDEIQNLRKYSRYAPAWIQKILHTLIEESEHG